MTLCMAAICSGDNSEPVAVIAADRMVTIGSFIEFEHTVPKMAFPSQFSVVMIAGDTLMGTRLARSVRDEFAGAAPTTEEIASRLAKKFVEMRREELEHQILSPRGLDLQMFYGGHQSFNGQITMMLDNQMAQYNLGVELLVVGVDTNGAQIFSVANPGQPEKQHDVIGYAAIGSGGIHALQTMISFRHSPTTALSETVFQVYAAKRRAEVAPGVGQDTDMAIITSGGITHLDTSTVNKLKEMYDHHGQITDAALKSELESLNLGE